MSGTSIGHSHPRPCSGKKTLRRCRNNEEDDNVILIDVDSENFDNVIIIDVPESLPKKSLRSSVLGKDKKWSFRNVIFIDDDETPDTNHSFGVNHASFSAGTSSNRESCRVAKDFADPAYAAFEECQYVPDTAAPVRLSKCKRTYSGKSTRNRYGLNSDSESDSSDSDYPDCELVEDSSGKVQELWEKAFSRRKKDVQNGHSDIRDHDSTSRIFDEDHHQNVDTEDATRQHKEASFGFSTGKPDNENDSPSCSRTKEDTDFGCTHVFDVADDHPECEPGRSSCHIEERCERPVSSNTAFPAQSDKDFDHPTPAFEGEETSKVEPCPSKFDSYVDEDSCYGNASPLEDEATMYMSKSSFETEEMIVRIFQRRMLAMSRREHLESGQPHATGGAKEMDNLMPERCSFKRSTSPNKQTDHSSTPLCDAIGSVSGKFSFSKGFSGSGDDIQKGYHQGNSQMVPEINRNNHLNEAKVQEDIYVSNIQEEERKDGELHSQNGDTLLSVDTCIINEREKLKETDEYKRAMEEEWASGNKRF
ncbi:hypothetical protein DH2020_049868 [Rehmannia glutinosa]|uniref:Uncharacterized protein n=1 Tax=Rehmannia glutinosa TaxID=99300 RepID=A0ABR0U1L8_REHGL